MTLLRTAYFRPFTRLLSIHHSSCIKWRRVLPTGPTFQKDRARAFSFIPTPTLSLYGFSLVSHPPRHFWFSGSTRVWRGRRRRHLWDWSGGGESQNQTKVRWIPLHADIFLANFDFVFTFCFGRSHLHALPESSDLIRWSWERALEAADLGSSVAATAHSSLLLPDFRASSSPSRSRSGQLPPRASVPLLVAAPP